ncbi:MAG TPA: hypothetical protein VN829_22465, partial [Dongiaceae bacterium]|nr:hypothetical protein [Dongiaceae bacterium]
MNRARLVSRLFWGLFLGQFALVCARVCLPHPLLGDARWPEGLLLLLAAGVTLAAQARQAPGQNVALAATIILSLAGLALAVAARTPIPLGPITGPGGSPSQLLGWLPWAAALWLVALLTSRGVARLVLRPWRTSFTYGFQVIGLTVLLFVLFNSAFEPFASCVEHGRAWQSSRGGDGFIPASFASSVEPCWFWQGGGPVGDWRGLPWIGLGLQAATALFILIFTTPSLIDKRPVSPPPDNCPLMIWGLANLLFTTAAITRHLWSAAALAASSAVVVTLLSLRQFGRISSRVRG